jgi:exodeoxyribonuclease X
MNEKIKILDTETTGITNHPDLGYPQIIEVAEISLLENIFANSSEVNIQNLLLGESYSTKKERFRPSMPIHEGATKIHGIVFKDLLGCRKSEDYAFPENIDYIIGHNISFDHRCLGKPDVKLICTLALAKALDKQFKLDFENHKLDTLIKHYYDEHIYGRFINENGFHDAETDCIKVLLLLFKFLPMIPAVQNWDDLHNFQQLLKKK